MKRFLAAIVSPILLFSLADQSSAQWVDVGPGYVRAPFVRVYRTPGGINVQAPFVNIYRGRPIYEPQPAQTYSYPSSSGGVIRQVAPSTQSLSTMDWQSLRGAVRLAASQLVQDLNRQPNATAWKSHLQVTAIHELVTTSDQPPEEATVEPLGRILAKYSSLRANPGFDTITSLASFRRLHAALDEYLTPPWTRQLRRLADSSRQLDQELNRLRNSADWQQYLALPPSVVSASGSDLPPAERPPAQEIVTFDELQKVRERFDAVNRNVKYQVIASLPAFRSTQEILALMLTEPEPPQVDAEELPPPLPETP